VIVLVISCLQLGCYREYPPQKPLTVPAEAVWAGGWDGGGWVVCTTSTLEYNECSIFNEAGQTQGSRRYVLFPGSVRRAARPGELRYKYLTGNVIGLEDGLELVAIS
jgi:hypothetical protein